MSETKDRRSARRDVTNSNAFRNTILGPRVSTFAMPGERDGVIGFSYSTTSTAPSHQHLGKNHIIRHRSHPTPQPPRLGRKLINPIPQPLIKAPGALIGQKHRQHRLLDPNRPPHLLQQPHQGGPHPLPLQVLGQMDLVAVDHLAAVLVG